jgi:hypothetical protein
MMTRQQMMMWDVLCGMSGEEVARAMTNYYGNRLLAGDFAEFLVDEGYCEPEEVGLDPDDYEEDDDDE